MNDRKRWIGGACVAGCLAVSGVVAAAGADDPDAPPPVPAALTADAEPVGSVEPDQAERIGQLRRGRTSDDALPRHWSEQVRNGDSWGANPSLSRRTAPGVWIVPGDDHVCLANVDADSGGLGFGCATTEHVERGLLAPSDVDAEGTGVVTGVVPDGVGEVTLVDRDGTSRAAPVQRNTYRAAIDADLKEIRFTGRDGRRIVLPMSWNP